MPIPSQFYGQFRKGRVSSVNKKDHTVQVEFFEHDGFVSPDMSMLVTHPGDYALPVKDTVVLCLIVDGRLGEGYVLGAIYTESDAAPLDDDGKRSIASDDLRLGDPAADKKVALAPTCKQNFDDIKSEFTTIKTALASLTGGATVAAAFTTPYSTVAYSPSDPAAEKVSAK